MLKYGGSLDFFADQVIADNEANEKPVTNKVTNYSQSELLQRLRDSKHNSSGSTNFNRRELSEISRQIPSGNKPVSTVYYPYCGADVAHVFLLFPTCTSVVGFGRDEFGSIQNLNYYNENDDFTPVPIGYTAGFDSHKYHEIQGQKYGDNKYKVCPDILLRITQILGGEILSVETQSVGENKDDIVYQIKFLLNHIERSFTYAKYEVSCMYNLPAESSPVRNFLLSQNPDALLLKAIPDVLLEYPDGLALAQASVTREDQVVISDARTYNWEKYFNRNEPQPVFLDKAKLHSINLYFRFGYGAMLFIGNGSQLKGSNLSEKNIATPTLDTTSQTAETFKEKSSEDQLEFASVKEIEESNPLPAAKSSSNKKILTLSATFFSPFRVIREKLNRKDKVSTEEKSLNPN